MTLYKEYTLLTLEDFKAKFKPEANEWKEFPDGGLRIEWKEYIWWFTISSFEIFGSKVKARKINEYHISSFTHIDINEKYRYHESWFEPEFKPIVFIEEDEMAI